MTTCKTVRFMTSETWGGFAHGQNQQKAALPTNGRPGCVRRGDGRLYATCAPSGRGATWAEHDDVAASAPPRRPSPLLSPPGLREPRPYAAPPRAGRPFHAPIHSPVHAPGLLKTNSPTDPPLATRHRRTTTDRWAREGQEVSLIPRVFKCA